MKEIVKEERNSSLVRKTKFFWMYFVVASLLIFLGVCLLPIWEDSSVFFKNWSNKSIDLILAILIFVYVVFYLIKNFKNGDLKNKKSFKVLKVIEIILLFGLVAFCVLEQFKVTNFIGPCFVVGFCLYLRGIMFGVKGYLYTHKKSETYSISNLIFSFVAITLGTILIVHPFYGETFMWIVSIMMLFISVLLIVRGFFSIPKKVKEVEKNTDDSH